MLQKILNALEKEFRKPTPFLLLGIFGIIFFTFVFFASLPDQTAGLGVAYAFFFIIVLFVAVVADRLVVRVVKLKPVIYSEFVLLLLLLPLQCILTEQQSWLLLLIRIIL